MIFSFDVATTLAAQRIVAITGGNTVGYPSGATIIPIGITCDTVKDTTNAIPVACAGEIAKLLFNDSVNAGALVSSDTSGRGIPYVAATTVFAYVGILVDQTVASAGTIGRVLVMPGFSTEG